MFLFRISNKRFSVPIAFSFQREIFCRSMRESFFGIHWPNIGYSVPAAQALTAIGQQFSPFFRCLRSL